MALPARTPVFSLACIACIACTATIFLPAAVVSQQPTSAAFRDANGNIVPEMPDECPCLKGFDYFQETRWNKTNLAHSSECRNWYDPAASSQLVKCAFLFDHIEKRQTLVGQQQNGLGYMIKNQECYSPKRDCTYAMRLFYRTVWLVRGNLYGSKCRVCHADCEGGRDDLKAECHAFCNGSGSTEDYPWGVPPCKDGEQERWELTPEEFEIEDRRRALEMLGPTDDLPASILRGVLAMRRHREAKARKRWMKVVQIHAVMKSQVDGGDGNARSRRRKLAGDEEDGSNVFPLPTEAVDLWSEMHKAAAEVSGVEGSLTVSLFDDYTTIHEYDPDSRGDNEVSISSSSNNALRDRSRSNRGAMRLRDAGVFQDARELEFSSDENVPRRKIISSRRRLMDDFGYYDNQEGKNLNVTEYEWPPCPTWVQQAVNTAYYYCGGTDVCFQDEGKLMSFEDIKDSLKRFIELELHCNAALVHKVPRLLSLPIVAAVLVLALPRLPF